MSARDMQGQYAGFVTRFMAWLIDHGIIVVIIFANTALTRFFGSVLRIDTNTCIDTEIFGSLSGIACVGLVLYVAIFALLAGPVYLILFWSLTGATPGKAVLGLRIVRLNGERMSVRVSLKRYFGYVVSFLVVGIGFAWILFDNRRQSWGDKMGRTCVVYVWSARENDGLVDRMTEKMFRHEQRIEDLSERLDEASSAIKGETLDSDTHADGKVETVTPTPAITEATLEPVVEKPTKDVPAAS